MILGPHGCNNYPALIGRPAQMANKGPRPLWHLPKFQITSPSLVTGFLENNDLFSAVQPISKFFTFISCPPLAPQCVASSLCVVILTTVGVLNELEH